MPEETKVNWMRLAGIAAMAITVILLAGRLQSCGNHAAVIESLYQEVQANHQAELDKRQANIKKIEAAQATTAAEFQSRIDRLAAAADAKVKALKWKSNEQLTREKAEAAEILAEKQKAEAALNEMTLNRDTLILAAHNREKGIADERAALKIEYDGALQEMQKKLDTCDKARLAALGEGERSTWLSIGPGGAVFMRNGVVEYKWCLNFQIPIIKIKSPFKRF